MRSSCAGMENSCTEIESVQKKEKRRKPESDRKKQENIKKLKKVKKSEKSRKREKAESEEKQEIPQRQDYSIYNMKPEERRNVMMLGALCAGCCGYLYFHSLIVSLVMIFLSAFLLPVYKRKKAEDRQHQLRLEFRDFLYAVSSAVNTGRSLEEALEDAWEPVMLIHGEGCMMASEISWMNHVIRETNCGAEPLLRDLARRSHIDEITQFVDVCTACRKTGGDLSALIVKASAIITQNIELTQEKHALLSQKKLESTILAAMPPAVIFLIHMASSDYLVMMYETFEGRLIMAGSLMATLGSFLWSYRLISFD